MIDTRLIKKEFGYMQDHIYLNISSVAMPPERVKNVCRNFMDDYVSTFCENVKREFGVMREGAKQNIARLIHAKPDEIMFVKNTTEGNSIFANGYRIAPDSNVITCDMEHPSNLFPWINAQSRGFRLKTVATKGGRIPAEDVIAAMDNNTKVVALSAVQYGSGYFADLKTIGEQCRKRGIAFVVDGIQALGRLDIDVEACCIDYLSCGGFKGLMGTLGAGFIYCNPRLIRDIIPPYAAAQSTVRHVEAPQVNTDFSQIFWYDDIRRLESGSLNTYGIIAMEKGVELILELGIIEIQEHIKALEVFLRDKLTELPLEVMQPEDPSRQSGIIAILFPKELTDVARAIMERHRIYLTLREGYMRISIGAYNTLQQMKTVYKALCELSEHLSKKE